MQTKGAIGNLINRYRAVLKKCHLINVFGSLAVAAMLVMGGAGAAMADGLWDSDQDIVITEGANVTTTTSPRRAPSVTVNMTDPEAVLAVNGNGALGYWDGPDDEGNFVGMQFELIKGTVNVGSESSSKNFILGETVTISGGTVNVQAQNGGRENGSYIGGNRGLIIKGGTITLGNNGHIYGGGTIGTQISGTDTAITMGKNSSLGFGGRNGTGDFNTIKDATITVAASGMDTSSAAQIILGSGVTMSSGNLIVGESDGNSGVLKIAVNGGYGDIRNLTSSTFTLSGGEFKVTNGSVDLDPDQGVTDSFPTVKFTIDGGTMTVDADNGLFDAHEAVFEVKAGTLDAGAKLEVYTTDSDPVSAPGLYVAQMNVSGGLVTAEEVVVGADGLEAASDTLTVSSLHVQESIDALDEAATGLFTTKMTVDGGVTVTADELTVKEIGGTSSATDGQLFLKKGTVVVDGITKVGTAAMTGTGAGNSNLTTKKLEFNGAGDKDLTLDNLTVTMTGSGNVFENINSVDVNDNGAQLVFAGEGGTINADVTVTNGKATVQSGSWTLGDKEIDVKAGSSLTISNGATLDASAGTLKNHEETANNTKGIVVADASSTLKVGVNNVFKNDAIALVDDDGVSKAIFNNGTVILTGTAEGAAWATGGKISLSTQKAARTALVGGGSGLIKFADLDLDLTEEATGAADVDGQNTVDIDNAEYGGELGDYAVRADGSGGNLTTNGGFGAKGIVVDNATNATTVTLSDNTGSVSLTGYKTEGTDLIKAANDDGAIASVTVGTGVSLIMDSSNSEYNGTTRLGTKDGNNNTATDVVLKGAESTLLAKGSVGTFEVGAVTVTTANNGTVAAQGGVGLKAASITGVANVNASDGSTLKSTGAISTTNLTADGGTVSSDGAITVTNLGVSGNGLVQGNSIALASNGSLSLQGGTVKATAGNVDLTNSTGNDITGAYGAIVSTNGNIDATGKNIAVAEGETLTLAANGTLTAGNIMATNVSAGTLTAGAVTVSDGKFALSGENSTADSLSLTTVDATVAHGLTVANGATISGGDFNAGGGKLAVTSGDVTLSADAKANIHELALGGTSQTIHVGTGSEGRATLTVDYLDLGASGGNLIVDPTWEDESSVAVVHSFGTALDADDVISNGSTLAVGQNSKLAYGSGASIEWLDEQVNAAAPDGIRQGGVESVLALQQAIVIGSGSKLFVGGDGMTGDALTAALADPALVGDTFTQKANTLLIINGEDANVRYDDDPSGINGAISAEASATANVEDGARLHIANAEVGRNYLILGDNMTNNVDEGAWDWDNETLTTDNPLVRLEWSDDGTSLAGGLYSSGERMPKLSPELVRVIDDAALANQIGGARFLNSDEGGVRFLTQAVTDSLSDADGAARTIEGAARIASIGAVPQMTRTASQAAAEAVTQRTSLAQPSGIRTQQVGSGVALWAMPLYQGTRGSKLPGGNFNAKYHGDLGGIAVGADYTHDNAIRTGLTFHIGGGKAEGEGDFAKTKNNMDFWGVGAYAGWTMGNFGLTGDISYTKAENDLKQDLPASMWARQLTADDVNSSALSLGLRGEYKVATSAVDIIPHLGVRFMSLATDSYTARGGDLDVLHGDSFRQNVWTFPVGVSFSKDITTSSGWHVKPMLDLAVVPAAGDIKTKEKVRFIGTDGVAGLETQVMDHVTWQGALGLEFGKDRTSFGLQGNVQAGARTTGYGLMGLFRYQF